MDYASALKNPSVKPRTPPTTSTQPSPPKTRVAPVAEAPKPQSPTIKPPSSTGIVPLVSFELKIPVAAKNKENDDAADLVESVEENEEELNGEVETKTSKGTQFKTFPVDGLEKRNAKINDLVAYLLEHCDQSDFELEGGFRFYFEDGAKKKRVSEFDLQTIPQALSWVNAVVDLLRNVQSVNAQDGLEFARAGNQVRVKRANKEVWIQFEELALEIREQGKRYLKVAQAVEDILVRKEARTGDKTKLDEMKTKRIAVSKKLQTRTFHSILKAMKDLFLNSDLPALKNKIMKQKQLKEKHNKILTEQNRDMNAMALNAAPSGFMEMDVSHIGRIDDPEPEPAPAPVVQPTPVVKETEEEVKVVPQEKQRKKTKSALRREQEQNFDKEDFGTQVVETQTVQTVQTTSKVSINILANNAYDVGDESILIKLSERETVKKEPKKPNTHKGNVKKSKETPKNKEGVKPTKASNVTKKQKQKNKPVKSKQVQKAKEMPPMESDSINPVVLVLVGLTVVAALYYGYTLVAL